MVRLINGRNFPIQEIIRLLSANEEYYDNFFQLELSEGGDLNFDYQSIEEEISVLIGAGLGETYV